MGDKPRLTPELRAASYFRPEFYFRRILGMTTVTPYQLQIANALANPEVSEVAARSANGVGKSFIMAATSNWWFDTRKNSKFLIAGPRFQQAKETFQKAMILRANALYELDGERQAEQLWISADWYIQPRSAKDAERFAGVHAEGGVCLGAEEASGQEDAIYAAMYGCITSDNDKALHIGNPTKPQGLFSRLWKTPGVETFTITAMQSPNYVAGENIVPGLVGRKGVQRLIDRFGADSDVVRVRVHGLPPEGSGNGVFGYRDVEDAKERGLERFELVDDNWVDTQKRLDPIVRGGLDVARMGDDTCQLYTISDGVLMNDPEEWSKERSTYTRDRALAWFKRHPASAVLNIDSGGGGAEVYDMLLEHGIGKHQMTLTTFGGRQIMGQFFSPAGEIVKKGGKWGDELVPMYHDRRTELWAEAAKWMRTVGAIHPGFGEQAIEDMEVDLLAPEWAPNETKSLLMEKKIVTKKRLGHSPDKGDAVCLAIAAEIGVPRSTLPPPRPKSRSVRSRATVRGKHDRLRGYSPSGSRRVLEEW